MKRLFHIVLLAGFAAIPLKARAQDVVDASFTKNFELLQVQMKLQALGWLQQNEFYVPPQLVTRYQEEQKQILEELGSSAADDFRSAQQWADEQQKVAQAENLELQKLAEKFGKKALKQVGATQDEVHKFDALLNQWRRGEKCKAIEMSRAVEQLIRRRGGVASERHFPDAVRQVYRGALKDTDNLVAGLVRLGEERLRIEACRSTIAELQKNLTRISDFEKSTPDSVKERIEKAIFDYQKSVDSTFDPEKDEGAKAFQKVTDQIKETIVASYETWSSVKALDDDRFMNPNVKSTAKGFTVMAAVYQRSLGLIKDIPEVDELLPGFVDLVGFYGDALALVPSVAQKVSAFTAAMDRGDLSNRLFGAFSQSVPEKLGRFHETAVRTAYGIELAFSEEGEMGIQYEERANHFYLIVPKEVMPRGFVTLSREQYQRLAQTLADERIASAFGEASRSATDFGRAVVGWDSNDPLVAGAESYLKDLKAKARQSPFREKGQELWDFARGSDSRARRWESDRDVRISALAEWLTIRETLGSSASSRSNRQDWKAFVDICRKADVPLAPTQILRLFNFYVQNEGNRGVLLRYLNRERERRKAQRLGRLQIGIPDVGAGSEDVIRPNNPVRFTADVIVSGLAPGRTAAADVVWTLPDWASPQTVRQTVALSNGRAELSLAAQVPGQLGEKSYPVTAEVRCTTATGPVTAKFTGRVEVDDQQPPQGPGEVMAVFDRIEYEIYSPDKQEQKKGTQRSAAGNLPFGYTHKWEKGHATMDGSISYVFPATLHKGDAADFRPSVAAQANWDNENLGYPRGVRLSFGDDDHHVEKKGFFNGTCSAEVKAVVKGIAIGHLISADRPGNELSLRHFVGGQFTLYAGYHTQMQITFWPVYKIVPVGTHRVEARPPGGEAAVPSVVGFRAVEAKGRLRNAGFQLVVFVAVAQSPPSQNQEFTVQKQDPPAGARVNPQDAITLFIYPAFPPDLPPPSVEVSLPSVVGFRAAEANRRLRDAGFQQVVFNVVAESPPSQNHELTVQRQDPPAGARVNPRDAITLFVYAPFQPKPPAPAPSPRPPVEPPIADPVAQGGKDVGWVITFDGKSSDWIFEYESPGRYKATEYGLAGAKGIATYDSATGAFSMQAATHDNYYAATYHWVRTGVNDRGNAIFDVGLIKFTLYHGKPPEKPLEYKATLEHKGSNNRH